MRRRRRQWQSVQRYSYDAGGSETKHGKTRHRWQCPVVHAYLCPEESVWQHTTTTTTEDRSPLRSMQRCTSPAAPSESHRRSIYSIARAQSPRRGLTAVAQSPPRPSPPRRFARGQPVAVVRASRRAKREPPASNQPMASLRPPACAPCAVRSYCPGRDDWRAPSCVSKKQPGKSRPPVLSTSAQAERSDLALLRPRRARLPAVPWPPPRLDARMRGSCAPLRAQRASPSPLRTIRHVQQARAWLGVCGSRAGRGGVGLDTRTWWRVGGRGIGRAGCVVCAICMWMRGLGMACGGLAWWVGWVVGWVGWVVGRGGEGLGTGMRMRTRMGGKVAVARAARRRMVEGGGWRRDGGCDVRRGRRTCRQVAGGSGVPPTRKRAMMRSPLSSLRLRGVCDGGGTVSPSPPPTQPRPLTSPPPQSIYPHRPEPLPNPPPPPSHSTYPHRPEPLPNPPPPPSPSTPPLPHPSALPNPPPSPRSTRRAAVAAQSHTTLPPQLTNPCTNPRTPSHARTPAPQQPRSLPRSSAPPSRSPTRPPIRRVAGTLQAGTLQELWQAEQ